ncbi:MAG TPA: prolipoprotein diacylglyceryl transferase [Ilumatobacteraceae bacterium]|nr:prolipoprotein diacylglyceryl transferase [Ilumatobacteraceae bacterium]
MSVIGAIPSPSSGVVKIGPLPIHMYGLCIALGVIAAVWLTGRRAEASGAGTRDDVSAMAVWAVIAGVIGARLYHVATDWEKFRGNLGEIPKIWQGGLGIPGGMLAGALVGMWYLHRRGKSVAMMATAAAPALPLAQAIGRVGNYFNQELFGKPTNLPWALRIDDKHLPVGYVSGTTFHPTFLYEVLWNLALCAALIWIGKHVRLRPGRLLAIYVVGYGIGRFWVEGLRIDEAKSGGGLRLNQWMAIIITTLALGYLLIDWFIHRREPILDPASASADRGFGGEQSTVKPTNGVDALADRGFGSAQIAPKPTNEDAGRSAEVDP